MPIDLNRVYQSFETMTDHGPHAFLNAFKDASSASTPAELVGDLLILKQSLSENLIMHHIVHFTALYLTRQTIVRIDPDADFTELDRQMKEALSHFQIA